MARQHYNITGTNPAGADQTPATALTRLRNLEAVDRFTGENLVDGGDNGLAFAADAVTLTHAVTYPAGNHVFFNKSITMGTGGTLQCAADGAHLYFVNCTIFWEASSGLVSSIGTGLNSQTGPIDARVGQGAAGTRSVNFYGCTLVGPQAIQNNRVYVSDIINSEYICYQGRRGLVDFGAQGSRLINTTGVGPTGDTVGLLFTYYGAPEVFEGYRGSFSQLEAPATFGNNQAILLNPNFTSLEASQRYRMQGGGLPSRTYQVIGPFNPPGNTNDSNLFTTDTNAVAWLYQNGGTAGGVINYYGWQPGFFQDIGLEEGVEGVNVRVETSATLTSDTVNTRTAANFNGSIGNQHGTIVDQTGALDSIVDYKTADTGLAVVGTNTQYASDGETFVTGQWIDWLRLGVFDFDGYTTNPTTETAQNFVGGPAPDGCVIAPIALIRNNSYNQFNTRFRARGYTHDFDLQDIQNGVIGTAEGNQTAQSLSPIDETQYIGGNLIGSRIKEANRNADNSPNFDSFTATSTVSLNDIGNALRALWAQYEVNANQGTTLQTGNFNETTYPTRIHIRSAAETTGANTWQETWGGARVASAGSGGQIRIAVLANGIAGADDDLYASLPGARTYNFAGLPLSDVPLQAQERLARVGNVHNVTLEAGLDGTGPSGSGDYYDIQFELPTNTITGTTILSPGINRIASQAIINLPTVIGDVDSDITLTRGRIIQNYVSTSSNAVGDEGIRAGSVWTNFETSSDVNATKIDGDLTIRGGSHAFTVAQVPTTATSDSFTWTFTGSPTLDITLPTGSPQGLVTIDTANQNGDESQYDIVKAWLDGITGLSYHNQRLDETAPTSGYWLVAPPLDPPIEYPIVVEVPENANGYLTVRNLDANTNEDFIVSNGAVVGTLPTINSINTVNYRIYYKLDSTVGGTTYRTSVRSISGNPGGDIAITPLLVNAFFTDDALTDTDLSFTFVANTSSTIIGTFSSTSAGADTTRATCQGAAVIAANAQVYFNWMVHNEFTVDPIDFQPGSVLFNNSVDGATAGTFAAGTGVLLVSNSVGTQTVVNNYTGYNTNQTDSTDLYVDSGIRQVFNSPIGLADIATVTFAVGGVITTAVQGPVNDVLENQTEAANAFNANPILTAPGREITLPNPMNDE